MLSIDLSNKIAVVTGATQGIGLGVSEMLAKAGCNIAGCGLEDENDPKALQFKKTIKGYNRDVFYKVVDVVSENQIKLFIEDVKKKFGKIDILISNAGRNRFTTPENCNNSFWDENINLNLKSHWLISKACMQELEKNKGTIIIMGSNHAFQTLPNCFPYNVAKSGLLGLVKALAIDWSRSIRTIGLAPGFIETEGVKDWLDSFPDPELKREEMLSMHPVKRFGTANEVGSFCAFLVSDYAGFISGTTYLIDGGRSATL